MNKEKIRSNSPWATKWAARFAIMPFVVAIALACIPFMTTNAGATSTPTEFLGAVPPPTCSPGDRTETGLDGQSTLAERASGATTIPYNCNLEVVGQFVGEGADHQMAWQDHCAYYTTNAAVAGTGSVPEMEFPGLQVIDVKDSKHPFRSINLDDPSLNQPWESLQVNHPRKLLVGVQAEGGSGVKPGFSIYDVSDCAHPNLLAATNLSDPTIKGHAGNITPDGQTMYGTTIGVSLYAVDLANPKDPNLIVNWTFPNNEAGLPHAMTTNEDGTLGFIGQNGTVSSPGHPSKNNGLVIVDLSQVQNRIPNPAITVISTLYWFDTEISEVAIPVKIGGKSFLVFTDEGGAGSVGGAVAACAAGLPPWGAVRLIDISDIYHPAITARLLLQVEDPANCALTQNDNPPGYVGFGYDAHDCGVDNPQDAKLIACSFHQGGIRVFDIHNPYSPKEIAYYKGAARGSGKVLPGSATSTAVNPNYAMAQARSRFVWRGNELYLWMTSSESGLVIAKFEPRALKYIQSLNPVRAPGNEEPDQ
jgi:hypothetical protein